MGCGCGGNKRRVSSGVVPAQARTQTSSRQPRIQSNPRQILAQQAQDQIRQNNGNPSVSAVSEAERKRRIQISLRNRRINNQ